MIRTRQLGTTGIEITPVGLGCWQFSGGRGFAGRFWPALDDEIVVDIVRAALDGGVNWFDTAEVYGWGTSERSLRAALHALDRGPDDVVVATKWWPLGRSASHLRRSIDARLANLEGLTIDLHQVHQPFALASVRAQIDAMADLVESDAIRSVGVSNFSARAMRAAHRSLAARGLPLASNQVRYNLMDRRIEADGILDTARELGITIIAYSPLAQGILTGAFHRDPDRIRLRPGPRKWFPDFRASGLERTRPLVDALREIAGAHDATPAQVALAWLLQAHGDTVVVIPGATRVRQVQDCCGAMGLDLIDDEMARLDSLSQPFGAA